MNLEESRKKAEEEFQPGDGEGFTHENYEVHATYIDGEDNSQEEYAGELLLKKIKSWQDMPKELEIDGVVYKPEF